MDILSAILGAQPGAAYKNPYDYGNPNPLAALLLNQSQQQNMGANFGGDVPVPNPQPSPYAMNQINNMGGLPPILQQIDSQQPSYNSYGPGQNQFQDAQGGPQLPVQSSGNSTTIIKQQLGAVDPQKPDTVNSILSGRFSNNMGDMSAIAGTGYGDYAQGVVNSALGKPQLGTQIGQERSNGVLSTLATLQKLDAENRKLDYLTSGGGGSVFMQKLALIKADPATANLPPAQQMALAQTGLDKGIFYGANGATAAPGYVPAVSAIAGGKAGASEDAKNASDIANNAEIERQKLMGRGEITPQAQLAKGQKQVSQVISGIGAAYDALDKAGGAVNTSNSSLANAGAYLGNTSSGQFVGKLAGTELQSKRNQIEQTRPLLINAIRQATGMSAKSMDSNAELQFYLKAATDPTLDIQANKSALQKLDQLYGLSAQQSSEAPNNGVVSYEEYFK